MQKRIVVTVVAAFTVLITSAQNAQKDAAPRPPKPAIKRMKELPPPPPPPSEPSPPDAPPPPPPPDDLQAAGDIHAFSKRNPNVAGIQRKNYELTIRLKSGKEEHYNLEDPASRKAVEERYGDLPAPPPPPPPTPKPPKAPKSHGTLS